MATIAFPASPAVNDTFTFNSQTWTWTGVAWVLKPSGTTSPLSTKGDLWGYSTTDARLPVGTNNQILIADSTQAMGVKWTNKNGSIAQTVAYSASPTVSWDNVDVTKITLTGNITITNSGAVDGQKLLLLLTQGGSGGYTVSFTSETAFGTDITSVTLSTAVGKMDAIGLVYTSASGKYNVIAVVKGY